MSLPPHQKQGSLFETGHQYRHLFQGNPQAAKFVFFSEKILPMLHQLRGKLATMYCSNNGRPSKEPVLMLGATLLQFMERLPDRDATGQCTFDLRWKMALGLEPEQMAFDPTCLVRFRQRLVEHDMEGIGFDAVIQAMQEAGYLEGKTGKQRVDSTYVVGLVSQMSRMELARETLRLALESIQGLSTGQKPARWGEWWGRYVENAPDYQLEGEELKSRFKQAGEDAVALLHWAGVHFKGKEESKAFATLRRFVEENFDLSGDAPEPTRKQPGGALRNPHDPEAKRRTKSTVPGKEWVGYQNQIAETVSDSPCDKGEPTPNVITAVLTQPASESDKHALPEVEAQRQSHGVPNPQVEYTDGGYTSGEELARFESEGRELRGPVARPHDRGELFNIGDFDICVQTRKAVCPSGKASSNCSKLVEGKSGKASFRFEFSRKDCQDCPLKGQCLGEGQEHRTVTVGEHHGLIQARRTEQQTDAFKEEMHRRNGIEATVSELARGYGLRRCRYRGLKKTQLQSSMSAAACNLTRWSVRNDWEMRQMAA